MYKTHITGFWGLEAKNVFGNNKKFVFGIKTFFIRVPKAHDVRFIHIVTIL